MMSRMTYPFDIHDDTFPSQPHETQIPAGQSTPKDQPSYLPYSQMTPHY